jgi:hypothetical protein
MKCPICNSKTNNTDLKHVTIGCDILKCSNCLFSFVDCSIYSHDNIANHQIKNISKFGFNYSRNDEYVKFLSGLDIEINSVLEIGTPPNYDFLKKVHKKLPNISLYSHDIIKNNLPEYIKFYSEKKDLLKKDIDILFCIHTLEHIPTNQLIEFVDFSKNVSKYFVFEVPYCKTKERVIESSTNPHYSFFTEDSIKDLFGDVKIEIKNKIIKFTNIK